MQRMGVLGKATKQNKNCLVFGDAGKQYKTLPFSQKVVKHFVQFSKMLQVLLATPTPRTLDEWGAGCEIFKQLICRQKNPKQQCESYCVLWTFRAAMIAERAAA